MPTEKPRLTFISYSRTDKEFALTLAVELKQSGFNIWLDQLDIPTGAHWDDEIEKALDACQIFMVILTPESTSSDNVKDEISYAIDSGKRVLPVLLENAKLPLRLRRLQYVDFTNKSSEDGVNSAKELLRKLLSDSTQSKVTTPHEPQMSPLDQIRTQQHESRHRAHEQEPPSAVPKPTHPESLVEKKSRSKSATKPPALGLLSLMIGVPLILLLLGGGGWFAWAYFQTSAPGPSLTPTVEPTVRPADPTETPTLTPTSTTPPTETTTIPITDTPVIQFPKEPADTIYFYFDHLNSADFDTTWSLLTEQFTRKYNPAGKDKYAKDWTRIGHVIIYSADVTKISDTAVVVTAASNLRSTPLIYYLIRDNSRDTWMFDLPPDSLDVSCSRAPKTLQVGIEAIVVSDQLYLRESPTDGREVANLVASTKVRVIDGPLCKLYRRELVFYWWWKVQSETGLNGWIVEGADSTDPVFIQPLQ